MHATSSRETCITKKDHYIVWYPDFFFQFIYLDFFYEQYNLLQYSRTKELDTHFSGLVLTRLPSVNVRNDDMGMESSSTVRPLRGFKAFLAAETPFGPSSATHGVSTVPP